MPLLLVENLTPTFPVDPRYIASVRTTQKTRFRQFFCCWVLILCCGNVFNAPLPFSGCLFFFHHSGFQPSCYNIWDGKGGTTLPSNHSGVHERDGCIQTQEPYASRVRRTTSSPQPKVSPPAILFPFVLVRVLLRREMELDKHRGKHRCPKNESPCKVASLAAVSAASTPGSHMARNPAKGNWFPDRMQIGHSMQNLFCNRMDRGVALETMKCIMAVSKCRH